MGKWRDVLRPPFSHIFKARGLKFGMHHHHLNGSKSAKQNFDNLFRGCDILVQSNVVN